jgi:hypothetical protein
MMYPLVSQPAPLHELALDDSLFDDDDRFQAVRPEIESWLIAHDIWFAVGYKPHRGRIISFTSESDRLFFKLRWG